MLKKYALIFQTSKPPVTDGEERTDEQADMIESTKNVIWSNMLRSR